MKFSMLTELMLKEQKTYLVTGAAGFIGSNLAEQLLKLGQRVVGMDNFLTGHRHNIDAVKKAVPDASGNFSFIEADARNVDSCLEACKGVDVVLHNAALGSVPRSIENPLATHSCNVDAFINMLWAAKEMRVDRFVYASSSSVYGDSETLPKVEANIGRPLSPYALTKLIDEQYARIFRESYGLRTIGLRYFNVFGQRQDPNGPYAAVIPKWLDSLATGQQVQINGDGETSRDFCFIENVVQANLLAANADSPLADGEVFNVAFGHQATLNELYAALVNNLQDLKVIGSAPPPPKHVDFRGGDVRHSLASIEKARRILGYEPNYSLSQGLQKYLTQWVALRGS